MPICWFCDKNPSDPDSAVLVGFQTGGVATSTIDRVTTLQALRKEIPVPRCKDCATRTSQGYTINTFAGGAFCILLVAGFLLREFFPDLSTFYRYAFPCGGAILGSIIGLTILIKYGDIEEGIKPIDDALNYPAVMEMKKQKGWHIDDHWQK